MQSEFKLILAVEPAVYQLAMNKADCAFPMAPRWRVRFENLLTRARTSGVNLPETPGDKKRIFASRKRAPMILQVLFWRILGCWVLAAVVAVLEVLPAYARGAMPAPSLLAAMRTCVRYGVVLTVGMVFVATFESVDKNWDFRVKPFSYDLTAYNGNVRQAVLFGFWACFMLVTSPVVRLLDRFVPNDRANAPAAETATE